MQKKKANYARHRQQSGSVAPILVTGLLLLIAIVCYVFCIKVAANGAQANQQYQNAPYCTGTGPMANESLGCRLDSPMTVTRGWVTDNGSGNGRHSIFWNLELRTDTGAIYTAEFSGGLSAPPIWNAVSVGQVVQTERYQDDVVSVSASGVIDHTINYVGFVPGMRDQTSEALFIGFSTVLLLFFVGLFILAIIKVVRG